MLPRFLRPWALVAVLVTGLLIVAGCSGGNTASPSPSDQIQVSGVWARPVSDNAAGATSAIYLEIRNDGKQADALVKASSDVARMVELHETKMENNVMKMSHVGKVALPAGAKTELKPSGLHIMLINLKRGLKVGDTFTVKLTFERADEREVQVTVREP